MKLIFDKITKEEVYDNLGCEDMHLIVYIDGTLDFVRFNEIILKRWVARIPLNMWYLRDILETWGVLQEDDTVLQDVILSFKEMVVDDILFTRS